MNEDIKANNKQTHKIMRLLWTIVQEQTGQPKKKKDKVLETCKLPRLNQKKIKTKTE